MFLEKAESFIVENKNLFQMMQRNTRYNDEPQMFSYSSSYSVPIPGYRDVEYASGFSFDQELALIRMLGESIERYSLDYFYPDIDSVSSCSDLKQEYIHPSKFSPFSQNQLNKNALKYFRISDTSRIQWSKVTSFISGKTFLLPSQLNCIHFKYLDNEPLIMRMTSSGVAAGICLDDALYRAILELVEHDSFMIHYLNKIPSPEVDLGSLDDPQIKKLLQIYKRYRLELHVLNITTDLNIPSFVALTIDRTGIGPAVGVGLKSRFSEVEAVTNAIEESLLTSTWVRQEYPEIKKRITITTIPHRAYYWYPTEMLKHLDFWLKSKKLSPINPKQPADQSLEHLVSIFKEQHMDIFFQDITHAKMKEHGFSVVRALIPELQPIYFDERFPYLGKRRLYTVPVTTGYQVKETAEEELNAVPHPLL